MTCERCHIASAFTGLHGMCVDCAGAELERAKAENARLAAALQQQNELIKVAVCPECDGSGAKTDGYGNPTQCRFCFERSLPNATSTALRELLGPTVELLILCQAYADVNRDPALNDALAKELDRLRAVMGGEK